MLNFAGVRAHEQTFAELVRDLTRDDLRALTDEMIDEMLSLTTDAIDADVVFTPEDPNANDTFGVPEEAKLAWTLGHVIVHVTASSEEAAAQSTTLARGIPVEGRSRFEVPWETMRTASAMRERLEESRRIRNAFLQAWPDQPHLDVAMQPVGDAGPINAVARFARGLGHDDSHLGQIREIMRQARLARSKG